MPVPIAMPGVVLDGEGISAQSFELLRVDYGSPEVSGRFGGVTAGWPLWEAIYRVGPLDDDVQARLWRSFLRKLRGQQGLFFGRDLTRYWPKNYPTGFAGLNRAGGGAFPTNGAASSWSVNSTRDALTLTGLPAGFVLKADDQVGFSWTTSSEQRRALVSLVADAAASGGGTISAAAIEPPLPTIVSGSASAYLQAPTCLMRRFVPPGESALGEQDGRQMAAFTLTARQDLLA
jgi:hypothetical protein